MRWLIAAWVVLVVAVAGGSYRVPDVGMDNQHSSVGISDDLIYGSSSGPQYGDPILVALTLNTDYEDSLKVNGGRFDAVYGVSLEDSLVAKSTSYDAADTSYSGSSSYHIIMEADNSSWACVDDGRASLVWYNIDLVPEFDGAKVLDMSLRYRSASTTTLAENDTMAVHLVTKENLQDWWIANNVTTYNRINRLSGEAWPDGDMGDYGRAHDFQDAGEFTDPGVISNTSFDIGDWVSFPFTEQGQWLADKREETPGRYNLNLRHVLVLQSTSGTAGRHLSGPRWGTATAASAVIIKMQPKIRVQSTLALAGVTQPGLPETSPVENTVTPLFDGNRFYFDPYSTSTDGDGSLENPFTDLASEAASDSVIQRFNSSGVLQNAGAPVGPGDVCVLLTGNHGVVNLINYYFTDWMGIVEKAGHHAYMDRLYVEAGGYLHVKGVTFGPRLRSSFSDPGTTYSDGPYFIEFRPQSNGTNPRGFYSVQDCEFMSGLTRQGQAWADSTWNTEATSGILSDRSSNIRIDGCTFSTLNFAINFYGTAGTRSHNVTISNCTMEDIIGDGVSVGYTSRLAVFSNDMEDFYITNANHVDMIQVYGDPDSVLVDSNSLISATSGSRDVEGAGDFAGILFSTANTSDNVTITNNVVFASDYDAIHVRGGDNVVIANNTVIGQDLGGTTEPAWINLSNTMSASFIINNICGNTESSYSGVTITNNSLYTRDFTGAGFLEYVLDGDPILWNLALADTSENVDAGTATNAPDTDILGVSRPQGLADDIGAYESQ